MACRLVAIPLPIRTCADAMCLLPKCWRCPRIRGDSNWSSVGKLRSELAENSGPKVGQQSGWTLFHHSSWTRSYSEMVYLNISTYSSTQSNPDVVRHTTLNCTTWKVCHLDKHLWRSRTSTSAKLKVQNMSSSSLSVQFRMLGSDALEQWC